MFKILLALLLIITPAWAGQWRNGTGEQTILGSSQAALIGYNSYNSIVQPLDNILSNHCNEWLQYASSSTMTVMAGTCVVSNSQGTIRLFMLDTSNTTITSANLDTGSLTANTTYYVYATAATNAATTSTYYISASNTAPSGQSYYYQIGSFITDANTQITNINNNSIIGSSNQLTTTKSINVPYQALTDLTAGCYANPHTTEVSVSLETGSISTSLTTIQVCGNANTSQNMECSISWPIRKGDFYEFVSNATGENCFIEPTSK